VDVRNKKYKKGGIGDHTSSYEMWGRQLTVILKTGDGTVRRNRSTSLGRLETLGRNRGGVPLQGGRIGLE